eukprot:TRINITY_DN25422_c0_g1_i3.p1 TRINITY_DN25422_c0_g1~~TRINITY_DN25422_c0_g1_i3.p1  ORF type:complete len:340 (-),score=73.78 TRINITY_DN25422_c0_g1_i3:33-1052(-)
MKLPICGFVLLVTGRLLSCDASRRTSSLDASDKEGDAALENATSVVKGRMVPCQDAQGAHGFCVKMSSGVMYAVPGADPILVGDEVDVILGEDGIHVLPRRRDLAKMNAEELNEEVRPVLQELQRTEDSAERTTLKSRLVGLLKALKSSSGYEPPSLAMAPDMKVAVTYYWQGCDKAFKHHVIDSVQEWCGTLKGLGLVGAVHCMALVKLRSPGSSQVDGALLTELLGTTARKIMNDDGEAVGDAIFIPCHVVPLGKTEEDEARIVKSHSKMKSMPDIPKLRLTQPALREEFYGIFPHFESDSEEHGVYDMTYKGLKQWASVYSRLHHHEALTTIYPSS